jgi:hypothetical protein
LKRQIQWAALALYSYTGYRYRFVTFNMSAGCSNVTEGAYYIQVDSSGQLPCKNMRVVYYPSVYPSLAGFTPYMWIWKVVLYAA